jgi:hypothetical protein
MSSDQTAAVRGKRDKAGETAAKFKRKDPTEMFQPPNADTPRRDVIVDVTTDSGGPIFKVTIDATDYDLRLAVTTAIADLLDKRGREREAYNVRHSVFQQAMPQYGALGISFSDTMRVPHMQPADTMDVQKAKALREPR